MSTVSLEFLQKTFPLHTVHHWPDHKPIERFEICKRIEGKDSIVFKSQQWSSQIPMRQSLMLIQGESRSITCWETLNNRSRNLTWNSSTVFNDTTLEQVMVAFKANCHNQMLELLRLSA